MTRVLKIVSAIIWGVAGVLFGLGLMLAGAQSLPSPGGALALIVGAALAVAAYFAHRGTCWLLKKSQRASCSM